MTASRTMANTSGFAVDPVLLLMGIALLVVGLVAITSASIEYADWHYQSPWFHSVRHLVYIGIAVTTAYGVYRIPLEFWLKFGWAWLFLALALLILVLIPVSVARLMAASAGYL